MRFSSIIISSALEVLFFIGFNQVKAQNCQENTCDILSTCPKNTTCLNGVNFQALIYNSGNFIWKGQSPTEGDLTLYKSYGFNTIRYGFLWELLQPDLSNSSWNQEYLSTMIQNVTAMVNQGMIVILDSHNYGQYNGSQIGQDPGAPTAEDYANMWSTLAKNFTMPQVMFGLMNEPTDQYNPANLQVTMQTVVNALRTVILDNQYILLPSNNWQGIEYFMQNNNYTLAINDTTNNSLIDLHNYFDSAGGTKNCTDFKTNWETYYTQVTDLFRQNSRKAFISEIGGRAFENCAETISQALAFMDNNSDVWVGWTAYGAEESQPQDKCQVNPTDDTSLTAFFMDCTNGDLVNKAFIQYGVVPSVYNNSCCQPGRDSFAYAPQNLTLQCGPVLSPQCTDTTNLSSQSTTFQSSTSQSSATQSTSSQSTSSQSKSNSNLSVPKISFFYPLLLLGIFILSIWLIV